MENAKRTTAEVLRHHLEVLGQGNVEATVSDYAPGAVIISPVGLVKGQAEIGKFFDNSVKYVLPPGSDFKMIEMVVEGELAFILWSADSPFYSIPFGTDTFVIRDGLIVGQTFTGQLIKK